MENTIDTKKSVTLSFKTSAEEKTALQQIANEKGISRSELIASLVHAYKHNYDFIGKSSPKEEELKLKLKTVERENRKLNLSLENAEHRIEMEQKSNRKYVKEQLEMNKTIFDLKDELKQKCKEIQNLNELINSSKEQGQENYNSPLLYTSLSSAVLAGLTLIFCPILFKNN
jgi:predicted RNase H-like nuclease (RuvC/YqgF family)